MELPILLSYFPFICSGNWKVRELLKRSWKINSKFETSEYTEHWGIDGFLWMIVFLYCSSKNRSQRQYLNCLNLQSTSMIFYLELKQQGRRNVRISERVTKLRGGNLGSYIAGSTIHNQVIGNLRDLKLILPPHWWFSLNNSDTVKAVTLEFCTLDNLLFRFRQSSGGGVSDFRISC